MLPLILRPLSDLGGTGRDATTPYGYGGAYVWDDVDPSAFWIEVEAWAAANRVVSLFARLSIFPDEILPFPRPTRHALDNVVRDLLPSMDEIFADYEHKVRKNIKKALRSEVTVEIDPAGKWLDDFHRIYVGTMQRRSASESYYFPKEFFSRLIAACPDETMFFHARHEGRIVSTELVLVGAGTTYSFLGGTDSEAFDVRPNDLLKHEIIRWSRQAGKRWFVLGGGYQPGDGIYQFKRAFAPNSASWPFSVGSMIFDQTEYDRLVSLRSTPADPTYFPAYRSP